MKTLSTSRDLILSLKKQNMIHIKIPFSHEILHSELFLIKCYKQCGRCWGFALLHPVICQQSSCQSLNQSDVK